MPQIESKLNPRGVDFKANAAAMQAIVDDPTIPLPGLVFGSLVERWNTFSPVVLSPEMRRFGEEVMAISRYRLASQTVESKAGGLRVGGMGTVTYRALGGDRYWLGVMHMLASFAFYSGVGVQTATGMGQARCVEK